MHDERRITGTLVQFVYLGEHRYIGVNLAHAAELALISWDPSHVE